MNKSNRPNRPTYDSFETKSERRPKKKKDKARSGDEPWRDEFRLEEGEQARNRASRKLGAGRSVRYDDDEENDLED